MKTQLLSERLQKILDNIRCRLPNAYSLSPTEFLDEFEKPAERDKGSRSKIKETDEQFHLERIHLALLEKKIMFLKDNVVNQGHKR